MRRIELAIARAANAPRHQELAVLVELHDAAVPIAVADEERAVGKPRDVGRPLEMRGVVARFITLTERHQQLLPVVGELEDLMVDVVHNPDVVFGIVRADENRCLLYTSDAADERSSV